jgi:hypothetical protein
MLITKIKKMKYWYVRFEYHNETQGEAFEYERVIQSSKEFFPLKEVMEMAENEVKKGPETDPKVDLDNDDFTIMIMNQVQINEDDFISFNEGLIK